MKRIIKNKNVNAFIVMFLSFVSLAAYMYYYNRALIDLDAYGFNNIHFNTLWIGFSLSWILLFMVIIYSVPKIYRVRTYYWLIIPFTSLFFAQICYTQEMGKFMTFSDLFVAGEGVKYIKSIFADMNVGMVLVTIFSIICMIYVRKVYRDIRYQVNHKRDRYLIFIILIIAINARLLGFLYLGSVDESNTWKEYYNAKNIYNTYSNPNTSMFVSGYYEYTFRSIYKYFYDIFTTDVGSLKNYIDNYNNKYNKELESNSYTGIFKGKNVIYIMMESIDSWIVDDDTMPTLSYLENTGLNFTKRYSPFFNGGQTINSEFALNTGMYAVSSRDTIYDIDNVDYKYSLANTLKSNGYVANSFHANTGTFYNRSNFHKLLGYDNHYSMVDMQREGILDKYVNYFSDYNMINNDDVFNLVNGNGSQKYLSFITTYSAHLTYTKSNNVYKSINCDLGDYSTNEERIYRCLANDTDKFLSELINRLDDSGELDNIVLVLAADHYVYGYSDSSYVAMEKGVNNTRDELQNTPFVIWSPGINHQDIDTILDTADVLPTMLNMLGIKYNPNDYLGDDVFSSNHDNFVWFADGTYIEGKNNNLSEDDLKTKTIDNVVKNRDILLSN
ncbi:MAG TPA: LTA synthase family protein, partial [Bacilli bacterium]|nr:LTA synthase family protein [Bacilli bacterium]